MCLYQTPGRRPSPITGRFVNTVTRGWVGARNERAPFRFNGAVVIFLSIDVFPGLGIPPLRTNIWLSFSQADLGPRSAQEFFFSGFLKSLKLFFRRFVLIASGTEIFWRIFEILTFFLWKHSVSIVTGLTAKKLPAYFITAAKIPPYFGLPLPPKWLPPKNEKPPTAKKLPPYCITTLKLSTPMGSSCSI